MTRLKASERDTIITSASGCAVTKKHAVWHVHRPPDQGWCWPRIVDDFEVMISANNQTYSYELLNELKNGQLKIIKTSDDGKVRGHSVPRNAPWTTTAKVYTTDASGLILTEPSDLRR